MLAMGIELAAVTYHVIDCEKRFTTYIYILKLEVLISHHQILYYGILRYSTPNEYLCIYDDCTYVSFSCFKIIIGIHMTSYLFTLLES